MGVSQWLARRAVRATRVLLVVAPGAFTVRVAAERAAIGRGWQVAESAASADVLLVVGRVGGELAEVVEHLWDAMPGPRARVSVWTPDAVPAALDEAAAVLVDGRTQVEDAAGRRPPDLPAAGGDLAMDHGGMDHGMDHGGMEMAPDGIPLAEGSAEDRDGLEMDALPVHLGPVLPHWPSGLVLDVTLHGDLVVDATARIVGQGQDGTGPPDVPEDNATRCARRCDEVAAVLALAGWEDGATLARSARDTLLDRRGNDSRVALADLRHRAERSRLLRWSLAGAGVVTRERADELGLPEAVVGDCRDRLLVLVDRAVAAARAYAAVRVDVTGVVLDVMPEGPSVPLEAYGPLVTGCDLGVARLLVASLGTPRLREGMTSHG